MSWIDKNNNEFIITTGDGKEYRPLWKSLAKAKEYNTAQFNFPNLPGTLVKREMPMGRSFTQELFFEGDDHLDVSDAFERSADDKRNWRVQHPYYGLIFVQPLSIAYDNSDYNVTKLNISMMETIIEDAPRVKVDPIDSIKIDASILNESLEQDITAKIQPTDINNMKATNNKAYNLSVPVIKLPEQFEAYYNAFNQASSFVSTATATPVLAMRATISLLSYPQNFNSSVDNRVDILRKTFDDLRDSLNGAMSVAGKQIFQIHGSALLSGMCFSSATPLDGDYTSRVGVFNVATVLFNTYNQFLTDLDSIQTPTGGSPFSFIPSASSMLQLGDLVYYSIANLYQIALNGRVERKIITERDTNVILLTHRFYGLDDQDNNMNELIKNNGWGLKHILHIEKGTKVVYYI